MQDYNNQYKMKNKQIITFAFMLVFTLGFLGFISAEGEVNVCCEKTTSGAWCQNNLESNCDTDYTVAPTNCDSTSFCKRGCCFDSQEGLCMENTAQRVCEDSSGTWADSTSCDIKQCQLGCCVLADQGAFVTFTRCKQLSGFFGIDTDFRSGITDEIQCIATASLQDKGACVTEDPQSGSATCKFTTRGDCPEQTGNVTVVNITSNASTASYGFYKDYLCTAEELGTDCTKTTKTTLIAGKDEVYYLDTCDNIANIYDASKYNDDNYWKKVYAKDESCGAGSSNAASTSCGNCDYYLGSYGVEATKTTGFPTYGSYICMDLDCETENKLHGESWCKTDSPSGNGLDTVGSKYYREICLFGEVITEPCAEFRNQFCIEGSFGSFTEAQCRTNRWQDCTSQLEQADCDNKDLRECFWKTGYYFSGTSSGILRSTNDTNGDGDTDDPTVQGLCLPYYPPGLQFWSDSSSTTSSSSTGNFSNPTSSSNSSLGTGAVSTSSGTTSATSRCALATTDVTIKWNKTEKPLAFWEGSNDWQCSNEECFAYVAADRQSSADISTDEAKAIAADMNEICYALGDCGGYINWVGAETEDGYALYLDNRRIVGAGGAEIMTKTETSTTGTGFTNPTTLGAGIVNNLIKSRLGK